MFGGIVYHWCVFWPANRCSACHSLVEINFLTLKQLFPSLTEENKERRKQSCTKTCKKRGVYQPLSVTLKRWLTLTIYLCVTYLEYINTLWILLTILWHWAHTNATETGSIFKYVFDKSQWNWNHQRGEKVFWFLTRFPWSYIDIPVEQSCAHFSLIKRLDQLRCHKFSFYLSNCNN